MTIRRVSTHLAAALLGGAAVIGAGALAPDRFDLSSLPRLLARAPAAPPAPLSPEIDAAVREALKDPDAAKLQAMLGDKLPANGTLAGGQPLVFVAAQIASPAALGLLIEKGANPDAAGPGGMTPLMATVMADRPDNAARLIESGARRSLRNEDGLTAADMARAFNRTELAALLATRGGVTAPGIKALSLFEALTVADGKATAAALAGGADANARLANGWTPLMMAAGAACADCIDAIVKADGRVTEDGKEGYGPLAVAVLAGRPDIVGLLLTAGANDPALPAASRTAYAVALGANNLAAARLLKPATATEATTAAEIKALAAALEARDDAALAALLDAGVSAKAVRADDGNSILLIAIRAKASPEALTVLLQKGADPNLASKAGLTPMLQAILNEDIGAVRLLLKAAAENNPPRARGSAMELVMARAGDFSEAFLKEVDSSWIQAAASAAIRKGDIATVRKLLLRPPLNYTRTEHVGEAIGANQFATAAWLMENGGFTSSLNTFTEWLVNSSNPASLDLLSSKFDRLSLRQLASLIESAQRRGAGPVVQGKLSDTLREWQATAFLLEANSSISVDGKSASQALLKFDDEMRFTDLRKARESLSSMGVVCNAKPAAFHVMVFYGLRARGYYKIEPGKCRSFNSQAGIATSSGPLSGFGSTRVACQDTTGNVFDYSNANDADTCRQQKGRMDTYYMFGDKLGKPIMVR